MCGLQMYINECPSHLANITRGGIQAICSIKMTSGLLINEKVCTYLV